MDQQLEDSLAMATDFGSPDSHKIIHSEVMEDKESLKSSMEQLESSVELQKIEGHGLMTEEHEEIMADLSDITAPDMPVLGVEDDLSGNQTNKGTIKLEMTSQPESFIPDLEMPLFVTVPPKSVHSTTAVSSTVTRVTPSVKPLAIAPKPVTFLTTKSLTLPAKKSFTPLQSTQRSGTIVGVDSSGRQVLFQMTNVAKSRTNGPPPRTAIVSGGANGAPKLKLVAQGPQQLVVVADGNVNKLPFGNKQTVVAKQPFINKTGQFTTTKKIVPAKGINQVTIPKLNLQAISTPTSASTPKYLTLQQAQQLGLLTSTQGVKVQQMQFADKPMQNYQVIRPTKSQTLIRSPTKILPAPAPIQGGKIVLPTGNQTVVIRSAAPKAAQVIKSGSLGNIKLGAPFSSANLTNVSGTTTTVLSGATLSPKTLQSLHVPGKFLRIVPANAGATIANTMNVSSGNLTNIAKIAPKPEATLSFGKSLASSIGSQRTLVTVAGGKTMLLPEGLSGFVQVPTNKLQTTLPVVSAAATIKKIVTKPPQKLIPVSLSFASTLQKISTSSTATTATVTPALLTNISQSKKSLESLMLVKENDNATITPIITEENHEMEDSKASLLPIISSVTERKESEENDQEMETDETYYEDVPPDRPDSPDDESGDGADSSTLDDGVSGEINPSTQHLLMLPASFLQQIGNNQESLKALVRAGNIDISNIKEELLSQLEFPPGTKLPIPALDNTMDLGMRPRKPCNCAKSQCLKLYCDCFANGEFCHQCNCNNCFNNLENEEERQKAIKSCLERNPNAFRPKIGKAKLIGTAEAVIRRHNKGCNCKRSGCLKNYCECYEAKIACSANCKCVGCRNVEETVERSRNSSSSIHPLRSSIGGGGDDGSVVSAAMAARTVNVPFKPTAAAPPLHINRQPCSFMTSDVIDAVCQCLLAAASEGSADVHHGISSPLDSASSDPIRRILEEYARCLQDIIGASRHAQPPGEAAA